MAGKQLPILRFKWKLATIRKWSLQQDHITIFIISQFTEFDVLSSDCNHLGAFQRNYRKK